MGKIYVNGEETAGPEDWKILHPERHWKTGYSAKALAYSWEKAGGGFPVEIKEVLSDSQFPEAELLIAFPEYRTPLRGGRRQSQTDLFVLAEVRGELLAVAVEGKVKEDFGPTVQEWLGDEPSRGKRIRLRSLAQKLGIDSLDNRELYPIRYQLLHRTAAAVIEAERFNARYALMLVHSFSQEYEHFEDYQDFLALLGVDGDGVIPDSVTPVGNIDGIDLFLAWVRGKAKFLKV